MITYNLQLMIYYVKFDPDSEPELFTTALEAKEFIEQFAREIEVSVATTKRLVEDATLKKKWNRYCSVDEAREAIDNAKQCFSLGDT